MSKRNKSRAPQTQPAPTTVVLDEGSRKVILQKTPSLVFPEMWLDVYVAGDELEHKSFAQMFAKARCKKADTPEQSDLVVFTGGVDVDPRLYGAEKHKFTDRPDEERDKSDIELYSKCYALGIPMFGVCRGAQFLHVMNGGALYQHVDNHQGDHPIYDPIRKRTIGRVSSVHHQMVMEAEGMDVVAFCGVSDERHIDDRVVETGKRKDIEAFFYRDTCCFGVQGHPEYYGYWDFMQWTLLRIEDFVQTNPDVGLHDKYRRLNPEILALRNNPETV